MADARLPVEVTSTPHGPMLMQDDHLFEMRDNLDEGRFVCMRREGRAG
jgi:hypothetical protein